VSIANAGGRERKGRNGPETVRPVASPRRGGEEGPELERSPKKVYISSLKSLLKRAIYERPSLLCRQKKGAFGG